MVALRRARLLAWALLVCVAGACHKSGAAQRTHPAASASAAPVPTPRDLPKALGACLHPDAAEWVLTAREPGLDRRARYDKATAMFHALGENADPAALDYRETSHTLLLFRGVGLEPVDDDFGVFAVQFYLETLNLLLLRQPDQRALCLLAGQSDIDVFMHKYCRQDSTHASDCGTFARLRCALDGRPAKDCPSVVD